LQNQTIGLSGRAVLRLIHVAVYSKHPAQMQTTKLVVNKAAPANIRSNGGKRLTYSVYTAWSAVWSAGTKSPLWIRAERDVR
jgi:hypothetical protein